MANVPKAITDLPVASAMGDDDLLVVSQNATTSSIKGELIKGYAQNAVASQVTAAQTAANQAGQSATQAEAARQGAAAAQTAAENAQDAAETARDQSVAAAGTIGDSVEQAQTAAGQASSAKDAAVAAQTAAETAKTAAETASGQAQTAATQAVGSATAAQTAATQAGDAKTDAETARNEAEASASSASNSASDAESAATEAEQAKTYIENMNMEGETLPAGSSVTVTKTTSPEGNLLFVIGVPQGIQGDKGDTGETGAPGPQGVSITNATVNEDGDLVITLSAGESINAGSVIGPQGAPGKVGPTGASVDRIERTSGTGAPGTTDTYTVYLTDGQTGGTFQVYNGSNGTGSGDFMADGSVPMTGDLQMGGHAVTGMADGTEPTDGATVGQLAGKLDSPDGGTVGQVLTKTADGSAWENAPSGLPDGGVEGQMLYKSADGAAWGDKPVMYVNVTMTSGNVGTADKTAKEIVASVEKGYAVYAILFNGDINLVVAYLGCSVNVGEGSITDAFFGAAANPDDFAARVEVNDNGQAKLYKVQTVTTDDIGVPNGVASLDSIGKVPASQLPDMDYIPTSQKGAASGVAELDSTGRVPSSQLPSYVDDVLEYDTLSSFPPTGEDGKIYIAEDTNLQYRWSGSQYIEISPSLALGETSSTAYRGDRGKTAYDHSQITNGNPHGTTAADVGAVPTTRMVNGHALSDNISLTAGDVGARPASWTPTAEDVGALTQSQADTRYLQLTGGTLTGALTLNGEPTEDLQAAPKQYVDALKPLARTITLTAAGWSSNAQTVTVSGVSASETAQLITPTPAIASQSAYYEAGIMCTGQAANSLTFTCQTVPTSNLTVYVVIQPLS